MVFPFSLIGPWCRKLSAQGHTLGGNRSELIIGLLFHYTTRPGVRGGEGHHSASWHWAGCCPLGGGSCGSHLCPERLPVLAAAVDVLSSTPTCQTELAELGKHGL